MSNEHRTSSTVVNGERDYASDMARRRYFIRHLLHLPEAGYDPIREAQHSVQPRAHYVSGYPRQRVHRVQRSTGYAEAVGSAVERAGNLEVAVLDETGGK